MKNALKKGLMSLAVTVCMAYAVYTLFRFYCNHVPLARAGECLRVEYNGGTGTVLVVSNNIQKGTSDIYSYNNNTNFTLEMSTLRLVNAKKVTCP